METSTSAAWLATCADPLTSRFGAGLTVSREGNSVRWGFAGLSAIVEMRTDGKLRATFVDREQLDAVSSRPAAAAYETRTLYALSAVSCSRMVADIVDFFSGVREPKFTFFGAYSR